MTAPDAPQVEPLRLTLEELIQLLAGEGMWLDYNDNYDRRRWCVMERDPYEGNAVVARDVTPCKAASSALGVPVVVRDPTAELAEFLERIGAFDENLEVANSPELLPCFNQRLYDEWKQLSIAARAALARVRGVS